MVLWKQSMLQSAEQMLFANNTCGTHKDQFDHHLWNSATCDWDGSGQLFWVYELAFSNENAHTYTLD